MKNKAIWALQVLIAFAFLGAGGMKLSTPKDQLRANPQMAWSQDFSDGAINAIASAQVAGAIGLVAPAATGILPVLTPIAGVSLGVLMGGAVWTHVQRNEPPFVPLVLGVLAATAGLLRWRQRPGAAQR
ncbi:MAG: DoxX family protein [Gemmatimonadaceae bacterium]|nr:DoxX family protein [Gemmatimonadaceae bacterium]